MLPCYLILIVSVLDATLLDAAPIADPGPDGDFITYIGPIQFISGSSTDPEQVLRIVGSVQQRWR